MWHQLCLFLILTIGVAVHARWNGDLGFDVKNGRPYLSGGINRDFGRWNFRGYGSMDFNGNWNAGIRITFKRSTVQIPRSYHILIQANQCHFDLYDKNGDGTITREEMLSLFVDEVLGSNLYKDLNVKKGNKGITKSEFYTAVGLVVDGCAKYKKKE